MKDINITISGQVGAGKTLICQVIEKALKKHKFSNVSIKGEEENNLVEVERHFKDKVKENKDKINVSMTTQNTIKEVVKKSCLYHESFVEYPFQKKRPEQRVEDFVDDIGIDNVISISEIEHRITVWYRRMI